MSHPGMGNGPRSETSASRIAAGPCQLVEQLVQLTLALSQISILRGKSKTLVAEIQWLTDLKIPEKANLRQSPIRYTYPAECPGVSHPQSHTPHRSPGARMLQH